MSKDAGTLNEAFDRIVAEARTIMGNKQLNYGPGNIQAWGEIGVLVRLFDKIYRLKNLLYDNPQVGDKVGESLDDTWTDILNYAVIALMLRNGDWGKDWKEGK